MPAIPSPASPAVRVVSSPASGTDALDLCTRVYSAAPSLVRYDGRTRWVMDLAWYRRIRSAIAAATGLRADPDTWIPDPGDMLFGIYICVRADGGEPHLETAGDAPSGQLDALIARVQRDPREVAMALAREALAPPPLGELAPDTMLAVASVPGKLPEEWRAAGFLWMAWPHAAEAWVHAVEMTAAQLRDRLAGRDHR